MSLQILLTNTCLEIDLLLNYRPVTLINFMAGITAKKSSQASISHIAFASRVIFHRRLVSAAGCVNYITSYCLNWLCSCLTTTVLYIEDLKGFLILKQWGRLHSLRRKVPVLHVATECHSQEIIAAKQFAIVPRYFYTTHLWLFAELELGHFILFVMLWGFWYP